jgi:ribose transport system permease protein
MSSKTLGKSLLKTASKQKAFLAVVVMFIMMLFFKTNFYTPYNLLDILNSASINEILAAGVTLVIICAGCDLSVGGILGLSGIIAIELMSVMPMMLALLCSLAFGALVGLINGFFVVHQKTEPFIITLGMGMVLKGVAQEITDAHPISPKNADFMKIANGKMFGVIPNLVIVMIVVLLLGYLLLRYTRFGRNCYAVGGDYEVAVYAGINARRTKWTAYVISGTVAALGGIMLSSKLNSGSSIYGDTTPLIIHCGAVIGGTSLIGGKGGIPQTFIGLLALGVLANCMNMLFVTAYIQQLVQGIVIVAIIWLDCYGIKRKREAV